MDNTANLLAFTESLKSERMPWDTLFQEVADFILPKRASFTTTPAAGDNPHEYLHDDTAPWSLDQFANGLHSEMVSPLTQWFSLQAREVDIRRDRALREWMDYVTTVLYAQFNSAISSFHPSIQEGFTDLGAFGYGALYSEWSATDGAVLFQARFPGEIYMVEDQYGRVRGAVRCYKITLTQFIEQYGVERLPESVKQQVAQGKVAHGKMFEMVHAVLPRQHPVMAKFKVAPRFAFGSVRVCKETGPEPLAVGGYTSLPFHIARWGRRTGEVYPGSPGITALPSTRRANAISVDLTRIINYWAEPAIQAPDDEFLAPYDLSPRAMNYYRPGTSDRIEAITGVAGDINAAISLLDQTKAAIQRAFFVDAFLTTADSNGQNVKATFIAQRRDERFRQLASMLSRVEREFLGGVISRTFDLCVENGLIPQAPTEAGFDIEYLSPIVRAQRSETLDGLYQQVELAAIAAQSDPSAMQVFNWDNIMQDTARDIYSLPAAWYRSPEELAAIRQQQAEAQQSAQLQAESVAARNIAGAVKDVSQAGI
jgi:hypothetical protein